MPLVPLRSRVVEPGSSPEVDRHLLRAPRQHRWPLLSRPTAGVPPPAMVEAVGFDSPVGQPAGTSPPALRQVRLSLAEPRTRPCPCIALVPTARVPSTASGFFLVVTFEYGDHPRWCRCARTQPRLEMCATRAAAVASRVNHARAVEIASQTRPLSGRTRDPEVSCDMYGSWCPICEVGILECIHGTTS